MKTLKLIIAFLIFSNNIFSQNYFVEQYKPFNKDIQSPEEFLGYKIGFQHTRHDLIVSYLEYLSNNSQRAKLIEYGKTHEGRKLIILTISSENNINNIDNIQKEHLKYTIPGASVSSNEKLPIIINLGYGVHFHEHPFAS